MKSPIDLILPQCATISKKDKISGDNFFFIFPAGKPVLYNFNCGKLIRQSYDDYHFFIEVFELEIREEITIESKVTIPGFFVIFLLQGHMNIDETKLNKNHCFAATCKSGSYSCHFSKGMHRFFYINPRWSWIKRQGGLYPVFIPLLHLPEKNKCSHLPLCLISPAMKKELKSVTLIDSINNVDLELLVMKFSKSLFSHYHEEVANKIVSTTYQLKEYIEQNFSNSHLMKASSLAKLFHNTIRTLDRNFKKEFNITPNQYIISLRMQKAKKLLTKGWNLKQIANETGYENAFNFSRAYKNFFGYSPSKEKG